MTSDTPKAPAKRKRKRRKKGDVALWGVTVGGRGHTVRAMERKAGGALYLRWWDPTAPGKRKRGQQGNYRFRSLGHTDKEIAETQAKELAARLLAGAEAEATGATTISVLFALYEAEVSAHKKGAQPREDKRRIDLWTAELGANFDPAFLTKQRLTRFCRKREKGQLKVADRKLKKNPSPSTIGADIVFLESVLNWAVEEHLLETNPVRLYKSPKTAMPRRPVASYDRYLKIQAVADLVDAQGLFGAFHALVEGMGWRVSAVCQIRASNLDLTARPDAPHGRIHKVGEVDKEGIDMWVPLSSDARAAIDRALKKHPVVGDAYLFPAPRRKGKPWRRWHARDLLERAERKAGLVHQDGGDWHPYRRKWATERKHLPDVDVAEAGGWKDLRSLQDAYQQTDPQTLLAVVSEPRKLREMPSNVAP